MAALTRSLANAFPQMAHSISMIISCGPHRDKQEDIPGFLGSAHEAIRSLAGIVDFINRGVASSDDPRMLGKALKGSLGCVRRHRVGDYRVLFNVQDGVLTVLVLQIGNRREVYR
jgi:mRNA interferase RelE/StbE